MPTEAGRRSAWATTPGALRVPEVAATFWIVKGLSTAMGESTSDYLVHVMAPELAVVLGFCGFVIALVLQFRVGRYLAWTYWLAVVMVGIFGTMAADVVHVRLGVPYTASTIFYAAVLAIVFITWQRTEHTLSIHEIDTPRREAFYWATVAATFAMGTALGDFTAYTLKLGYFPSACIFAGLIVVFAIGYRWMHWNAVLAFWLTYVMTRPLGASIADGLAKSKHDSGLEFGDGSVVLIFGVLIAILVTYLAITSATCRPNRRHASATRSTRRVAAQSRAGRASGTGVKARAGTPRVSSHIGRTGEKGGPMRKFAGVVAGAVLIVGTLFASSAGAAGTANYSYTNNHGGDSSTCGPDWANDTYTRGFHVVRTQNNNGTYRVTETFTAGHFVTLQGPSPESCAASDSNQISAHVRGAFHGSEVITVTNGTFTNPQTIDCGGNDCTTDSFIAAAFGPNATYSTSDYFFEYTTGNPAACARDWVDAATGDGGDIATICS